MSDPQININKFNKWHESKSLEDLLTFINLKTRELIKSKVCEDANIGYSALKPQNGSSQLIKLFKSFEKDLIKSLVIYGHIPDKNIKDKSNFKKTNSKLTEYNQSEKTLNSLIKRNTNLEKEVFMLQQRINSLEKQLKQGQVAAERYRETIQVINEVNGLI